MQLAIVDAAGSGIGGALGLVEQLWQMFGEMDDELEAVK
jgi:hypothetical protein